jgi:hypothetical protein
MNAILHGRSHLPGDDTAHRKSCGRAHFPFVRVAAFALGLLAALASAEPADVPVPEPLRISLPPVARLRLPKDSPQHLSATLTGYLREKLALCASARVVPAARNTPILEELLSGAWALPDEGLLDAYSRQLPIQGLIRYAATNDTLHLTLHTTAGLRTHAIPTAAPATPRSIVLEAAAWIGRELALTAADQTLLATDDIDNPDAFAAYYFNPSLWLDWKTNAGEQSLEPLQPFLSGDAIPAPLVRLALTHLNAVIDKRGKPPTDLTVPRAVALANKLLPHALATVAEDELAAAVAAQPEAFLKDLLDLCEPLLAACRDTDAEVERMLTVMTTETQAPATDFGLDVAHRPAPLSQEKQTAALRLLAAAAPAPPALQALTAASRHADPAVRFAAALTLRPFPLTDTRKTLERLGQDKDAAVALAGRFALWAQGEPPANLLALARQHVAQPASSQPSAIEALAALATAEDRPALLRLRQCRPERLRRLVCSALLRLAPPEPDLLRSFLNDDDAGIVELTLAHLAGQPLDDDVQPLVRRLAADPAATVSAAARALLMPLCPSEPKDRLRFELELEHPYVRRQLLERAAADATGEGLDVLEAATRNADPYTRTYALTLLAGRAPARARPHLRAAISDAHLWVRLHGAALLAPLAEADDADSLAQALAANRDPAVAAYLESALARAQGRPAPAAGPAAHRVDGARTLTWNCGLGAAGADSPFQAYYMLNVEVNDVWRRCHGAGKIFFGRLETEGHPGRIAISPAARNRFWLALDRQLPTENLACIDGVVLGEESMSTAPDALWAEGWTLFCRDAALDPQRVDGRLENLNRYERRAWTHWSLERAIDGFNEMARYLRLRHARIRPGLQIATFLPEESLTDSPPNPAVRRWDFDVGGLYDYKNDNRIAAYTMVRRYQTLWPERPIIWLSLGFGGWEMKPVTYTWDVPLAPLNTRSLRGYADTVTAWLAGADAGWFSPFIFVHAGFDAKKETLHGIPVSIEDITPQSEVLTQAINYAWKDVDKILAQQRVRRPNLDDAGADPAAAVEAGDSLTLNDEAALASDAWTKDMDANRERYRRGFLLYQKYIYDCARVFADLPRLRVRPPILAVRQGLNRWSREPHGRPVVPGMALPAQYDFLCDLNTAAEGSMERYRLILAAYPGPLRDATLANLTAWLNAGPNLLYVHGVLDPDNTAEASTPADFDGMLANDWPWEANVTPKAARESGVKRPDPTALTLTLPDGETRAINAVVDATYQVRGDRVRVLAQADGQSVLVFWRAASPGGGGVLFDGIGSADGAYLRWLQTVLNDLNNKENLGVALSGPLLHVTGAIPPLTGAAAARRYGDLCATGTLAGVELLTGAADPVVDAKQYAALAAQAFVGKHVAAIGGYHVLSDAPLQEAKVVETGILVHSEGLVRITSRTGTPQVTPVQGQALPQPKDGVAWLLYEKTPGQARIAEATDGAPIEVLYFRSPGPVRVEARR